MTWKAAELPQPLYHDPNFSECFSLSGGPWSWSRRGCGSEAACGGVGEQWGRLDHGRVHLQQAGLDSCGI